MPHTFTSRPPNRGKAKNIITLILTLLAIRTSFCQTRGYKTWGNENIQEWLIDSGERIINSFPRQYIRFQDGRVQYIGKFIYENLGSIPKTEDFNERFYRIINTKLKVLDVTDEGCIVVPVVVKQDI